MQRREYMQIIRIRWSAIFPKRRHRGHIPKKIRQFLLREWAQTAAIGIALRNAGFGLQFQIAGEVFDSVAPNELEQTPAKQSDTQNSSVITESTVPDTDSSQNSKNEEPYTAEEYTAELTERKSLKKHIRHHAL